MSELMNPTALVIVDAQRGFMPASEGERLGLDGFGALGVEGGEKIVDRINAIVRALGKRARALIATTQDWHPEETGHFSPTPNYVDTWPVHCVAGTDGAELHPGLLVAQQPGLAKRFIKGDEACESPADDTSYTGALAYDPTTGTKLPEWLKANDVKEVYVAGLALGDGDEHKLCVDSTAVDLFDAGFKVSVVTDAAEAVMPDNRELCFTNMARRGLRLVTTEEVLAELEA